MFSCSNVVVLESRKVALASGEEKEAFWKEESILGFWYLWGNLFHPGPLCHLD